MQQIEIDLNDLKTTLVSKNAELETMQNQLLDLNSKLYDIEINPQEYADLESLHDDLLDEIYNEICEALPISVTGSELIREHDPIVYRCSFSDFCSDFNYKDLDIYQDTENEINDIEDQISDLECEICDIEQQISDIEDQE